VRLVLDARHHAVHVVHVLRERYVEHRPRRLPELEALPPGVADDADDRERADVLRLVEAEVLADRILVALEEALANASLTIATGAVVSLSASVNARPARHRHAEVLQVVRAHAIPRRAGVLAGLRRRMAGDENQLAPVVGQRVVEREVR
jgi:hypothetical protein